jgi:hypothetical protein
VLAGAVIQAVKTPPDARANACTEHWIRPPRAEVTDRMLIFGNTTCARPGQVPTSLRHAPASPQPRAGPPRPLAEIIDLAEQRRMRCEPVLGGLINEYEQAA